MRKTIITAIAAFALVAPFAPLASAAPGDHQGQYQDQRNGDQAHRGDQVRDRNGRRQSWRDTRRDARWDDSQHNGYYMNNQWHFGPPPQARRGQRNVTLGYHPWSRGQRLGYYNNRYSEVDYRRENLRQPRRGYHWVRDNEGDLLLAAVATGIIIQVITSNNRH